MPNINHTSRGASWQLALLVSRINTLLGHIETALLCSIILLMVSLALLKIILRYLFHTGIMWNELMLQHFTLWLAFLGASLATCEKRHISIDLLTRLLPPRITQVVAIIIDAICLVIVGILTDASIEFLRDEQTSSTTLVGSVPMWWAKVIIPLGFILIAVHFTIHIVVGIIGQIKGETVSWER